MSNKKVYVAKSHLATGLDVQYVKSSLARIKGIDVVEAGLGIKASECELVVLIPGPVDSEITISKAIYVELDDFEDNSAVDDPDGNVLIYSGTGKASDNDTETSTPMCIPNYGFYKHDEDDATFENYGIIETDVDEEYGLLTAICDYFGFGYDYKIVPRNYEPDPKYAISPIPSVDQRRMKKTCAKDTSGSMHQYPLTPQQCYKSSRGNKMLLLVRKRRLGK